MNNTKQLIECFERIDIYISNINLLNEQGRVETLHDLKKEIEYLKDLYFKI